MKPVLFSGFKPTGPLHLGNYLGALKNSVALQHSGKYRCFFSVVDYHSLTVDYNPKEKYEQIMDVATSLLASGIDPQKSVVFIQSAVSAHAELTILLNNFTPFGELRRMIQFKEESKANPHNVNVGLFDYPVLMASDILLYNTKFVPVGEDQLQHLELSRTIARRFNTKFGKTFIEPQPLIADVPRLMRLDDPTKKMSKSRANGHLYLDDPPETIRKKIMTATTDSGKEIKFDEKNKPGLSNLLLMYSALSGKSIKEIEKKYENRGYADFKKELAEVVVKILSSFQEKKRELNKRPTLVKKILTTGNKKANAVASKKLLEVKRKIGLLI